MIYYEYEEVLLKVDRMFCEERYIIAMRYLQEVLEDEPNCGRVHYKLGWLYWKQIDDLKKAEEHFKLALKFAPEYPLTYYSYALLLNCIGDAKALSELLSDAMEVRGVNPFFINNELGKAMEMNREFDKAVQHYEFALNFTIEVRDIEEVKSSLNRAKQKRHDAEIRGIFSSEARS